jgi:hypothetical protein
VTSREAPPLLRLTNLLTVYWAHVTIAGPAPCVTRLTGYWYVGALVALASPTRAGARLGLAPNLVQMYKAEPRGMS